MAMVPDVGRDVVVLRIIVPATPDQPSRDIWTVIRAGKFYGTHDDFDAALHAGHKLAADAVVRCWQSDGQLLIPARRPVGQ